MPAITTKDGIEIFYKDWGAGSPSSFSMAGRCRPMTGIRRCFSSRATASASSRTTGAHGRSSQVGMATTWITTPTTSRR